MARSILRQWCAHFLDFTKNINIAARNASDGRNTLKVVASNDGKSVVCWHPEVLFPYENSLPIKEQVKYESDSVLKVQNMEDVMSIFRPKKPEIVRQELMRVTHTTMHRWFPKSVHKRRRRRPFEFDRPYL